MDRYESDGYASDEPPAISDRELLEWAASFSPRAKAELRSLRFAEAEAEAEARHDRELLEWLASFSERHEFELHELLQKEAEERESQERSRQFAEEKWIAADHPRQPKGTPDGGKWVEKNGGGGSGGGSAAASGDGPFQTAVHRPGQSAIKLTATGGATSANWPTVGPATPWLPKVGAAGASAGVAAGVAAGGFLAGLRNASMGAYWARVPGTQAMPQVWVYELEKRVRVGTLSREDAVGIFNTAVLGAQKQGFKPTGNIMSAVHKSAVDFLGKAEAIYFARKREKGWAKQPGGYQKSGGRVFPTKQNSGHDGYALRQEQEKFFERGLAEGKDPGYLRGQAAEAGSPRAGGTGRPDDRIMDPEAEAALQRAIKKAKK